MNHERIFGHISRDDFVGRDSELRHVLSYSSDLTGRRLLIAAAPNSGGSEFLRQAYDELFFRRTQSVPFYFAFAPHAGRLTDIAADFFRAFVQQYVAYRRVDPTLCHTPLTLHDSVELALPTDDEAINALVESFERARLAGDDVAFLKFCLAAPQKVAAATKRMVLPLIDCLLFAGPPREDVLLTEIARTFIRRGEPAVVAALRRQIPTLSHMAGADLDDADVVHLDFLPDENANALFDSLTRFGRVETNEQTRDLIVQQLRGSPFFLAAFAHAARSKHVALTTFLDCQKVYVDELMGGRFYRHFSALLHEIAPNAQTRRTLLRVLYESGLSETRKASVWTWKKRLGVEGADFERMIDALHVYELVNASGATVELNAQPSVWMDYLQAQYQLEVAGETRALIVANTLLSALKRAPQTMRRKYRREAAIGLKELLARFNCQEIPASLLDYNRFAAAHRGVDTDIVNTALDAEPDIVRLPQIVSAVDCSGLVPAVLTEEGRCAIGHGFDAADYVDENEIIWIAAEIDSKLEATAALTTEWCERLETVAREAKLQRFQLWLVSAEGFSKNASEVLKQHHAYNSSRRQIDLLSARLQASVERPALADEYEMVIPMGTDTELVAAHAVEQIARHIKFSPEAINQIKLALVEACINATEHSLSPDRKIYQRFRVEGDKLTVTVASRGVVPANLQGQNGGGNGDGKSRRGWGLKLIKTLMDEVEFERVDDGTQLRMTKYLRPSS
jgi:serine/threonine-protein kinase RsbW